MTDKNDRFTTVSLNFLINRLTDLWTHYTEGLGSKRGARIQKIASLVNCIVGKKKLYE